MTAAAEAVRRQPWGQEADLGAAQSLGRQRQEEALAVELPHAAGLRPLALAWACPGWAPLPAPDPGEEQAAPGALRWEAAQSESEAAVA